jgi:hypothetical protein
MKYQYAVSRILDHFPGMKPEDVTWRLRQSTFVSLRKRYLYFEVLKAASTQMIGLLRKVENAPPMKAFVDGVQETRRDQFIHARQNVPLRSLAHLDDMTQKEVLESPDFLRITVVRNPYTRLMSAWKNKIFLCEPQGIEVYLEIKGGMPGLHHKSLVSFKEFVDYLESKCDLSTCDPHWRRQVDHTFFPALNFSCVARVEQLGQGLRPFAQHLGLSESLVAAGKNESLPVATDSYSDELAEKVYSLYQPDFEVLGYDRNTWTAGRQNANRQPLNGSASISEEKLINEIIERNLIILNLYEQRDRLQAISKWVLRLHLPPVLNALFALHSISRKATQTIKRSALRLRSQMQMFL